MDNGNYNCQPVNTCGNGQVVTSIINHSYPYGLTIPNSNLQVTIDPTTINNFSNQVCWDIEISNYTSTNNVLNNPATNVYLNVPCFGTAPGCNNALTNWTLTLNNNNIPFSPDPNHLNQFQIDDYLPNGQSSLLSGQLCASYNSCQPSSNFQVNWGWNCDGFPETSANVSDICSNSTTNLTVINSPTRIEVDLLNQYSPPSIVRCSDFSVKACFKSLDLGQYTPLAMDITNLTNSGLTVALVTLKNCGNGTSVNLTGTNGHYLLSQADLISTGLIGGIMNLNSCICFEISFVNSCDFDGYLPNIELSGLAYCGSPLNAIASFPKIQLINTGATCSNCSSFDKTISSVNIINGVIPFGTTANYNFEICNFESSVMNYTINDIAPCFTLANPNALPITNINVPAGQCTTLTVSGTFIQGCPTQLVVNTATLLNTTNNTNYTASASVYVTNNCNLNGDNFFTGNIVTATKLLNAFSSTTGSISNQNIYIAGDLHIDQNIDLLSCNLIMEAGKEILVADGQSLKLHSTAIKGCTNMWKGIKLNENSYLSLEQNCLIQNAEVGIEVLNYTSRVRILQAIFDNCIKGVDFSMPAVSFGINSSFEIDRCSFISTGNFLSDYSGQVTHGLIPYCGINFKNYGGIKYLQKMWEIHIGSWKGWV
jgi:hypothetical protein